MDMLEGFLTVGVIGFVLLILNAIFLGIIFFTRRKMQMMESWSQTMGTVTMSMLEARSSSEGGYTQYPVVRYSYQAGGQTYQGGRIAPGMEVGGSGAEKVIARYPLNSQVAVYYDPQNPSDAVLEKSAPSQFL